MSETTENEGGRPPFVPTSADRRQVAIAAGGGMSHEEIAIALGISRGTLEKHFEAELSQGAHAARVEVLEAMHGAALKGNASAARAYLATEPQIAVPPLQDDQKQAGGEAAPAQDAKPRKALGKKEQAQLDAKTAADGTAWDGLLPGGGRLQ